MKSTSFSFFSNTFPSLHSTTTFPNLKTHNFSKLNKVNPPFIYTPLKAAPKRTQTHIVAALPSSWDEKPHIVLPNGKVEFLDEGDVVSFLDPPKELIPLDPSSYNPAAYLWKKIEDIPEERRHRLLFMLNPRLISKAWEIAGTRYDDPKLAKKIASTFLSNGGEAALPESWNCRTSGGPVVISWLKFFKKVIFCCKDGRKYGRFIGGSLLQGLSKSLYPMYFTVSQFNEVMPTEQPCDFAYELGDGLWDLPDYPKDFPKPAKHPWPFNDQVVIYIRHVGPGVLVGQAWQEGAALKQVPKKLCGEILMVKDYVIENLSS